MRDPDEGVAPDGTITTGVARDRVPPAFEPVLEAVVAALPAGLPLYLYGSVATGRARAGRSDVDLVPIGLAPDAARALGRDLSARFADLCRGVELAPSPATALRDETDQAYGDRVFLRHYCVHLAGPDPAADLPSYPADARAARGFNGDIAVHLERWRTALGDGADPAVLGRRVARKTLLTVAGLVSLHDGTWTTDRATAATRWSEIDPVLAPALGTLLTWSDDDEQAAADAVRTQLETTLPRVVDHFHLSAGLWTD